MKLKHLTIGALLAIVIGGTLVAPGAEPAPVVKTITKAEYTAAVGPLLDKLDAACRAEFAAKRYRINVDEKGNFAGCEVKP